VLRYVGHQRRIYASVTSADPRLPRLRQAVLAARDLEPVAARLTDALDLREPFADPNVSYFGLRNAVFAIGDTFLEIVSPVQEGTAAGRLLDRRGGDTGYMAMFQVPDVAAARARAAELGVREVFEVGLDDITEAHLHPADMRGAIVSISEARPATSWRWGGPEWEARAADGAVAGITVAVADPDAVRERWSKVVGELPAGVEFVADPDESGIVEIRVERDGDVIVVAP
jgi:hypothetical protein